MYKLIVETTHLVMILLLEIPLTLHYNRHIKCWRTGGILR